MQSRRSGVVGGDACLNRGRGWTPLQLTGSRSRVCGPTPTAVQPPHENGKITIGGAWDRQAARGGEMLPQNK
jgi:hypothetical protein